MCLYPRKQDTLHEERALQTRHASRSEEHQVGMRSFCRAYDFLCRKAFDQQGIDRQAAMRHDLAFLLPKHKHRVRNRSSKGLCPIEQQGHGGGASGRDLTVLPA